MVPAVTSQILGLERDCSEKDIKQAYRKMALEHHPDKLGANATEEDQQRFMDVRAPRSRTLECRWLFRGFSSC